MTIFYFFVLFQDNVCCRDEIRGCKSEQTTRMHGAQNIAEDISAHIYACNRRYPLLQRFRRMTAEEPQALIEYAVKRSFHFVRQRRSYLFEPRPLILSICGHRRQICAGALSHKRTYVFKHYFFYISELSLSVAGNINKQIHARFVFIYPAVRREFALFRYHIDKLQQAPVESIHSAECRLKLGIVILYAENDIFFVLCLAEIFGKLFKRNKRDMPEKSALIHIGADEADTSYLLFMY